MNKVTITVGWSGDGLYCLEDVNKLYRGVKRNTTVPYEFVLFPGREAQLPHKLDGLEEGVRVINSPYHWHWTGMKALEPGVIDTDLLTLGLDVVIVGSLDDIINYPSEIAMMRDNPLHTTVGKHHEGDVNCEVMLLRNGKQKLIWDAWVAVGQPQWDARIPVRDRVWPMAQQGWINDEKPFPVELFPDNWVASYKLSCRNGLPIGCRMVSFHGDPKPKAVKEQWVKECWV
jgi:hypothetical protein